jgi:hypothetical protein
MKIEVNVEKKHAFLILSAILIIGGIFAVKAYGTTNPAVFGHSASEVDPDVFAGGSAGAFTFPGKVRIGGLPSISSPTELVINDSDNTNDAGIAIVSKAAVGKSYIDFYSSGSSSPKANVNWDSNGPGALNINSLLTSSNTIINPYSGSIGLGKNPVAAPSGSGHRALTDVFGSICLNGICKGDGTATGAWGRTATVDFAIATLTPGVGSAGYQVDSRIITPYSQGNTIIGGSASFCALAQTEVSGSGLASTPGAGCYIQIYNGLWNLTAYRNDDNQGVVCRAICNYNL